MNVYDFQHSHQSSVIPTISWYSMSSEDIHYENVSFNVFHLLTIDYNETGPLEIAVTFSNDVSNIISVTDFYGKIIIIIIIIIIMNKFFLIQLKVY